MNRSLARTRSGQHREAARTRPIPATGRPLHEYRDEISLAVLLGDLRTFVVHLGLSPRGLK